MPRAGPDRWSRRTDILSAEFLWAAAPGRSPTATNAITEVTSPTNFRFWILRMSEDSRTGFGISIVGKSNPKCSSKDPNHVFLSVNPKSAIENLKCHLMTRSALTSTLGGIVRPICFAALRLMMNSNFVACCTGKSAGLAPFKILST